MFHAGHCVDPEVVLRPAVSHVDVSVIGDVVAAVVFLETWKSPRAAVAEVKPAPPLVPHLHLSAIVEPDAEADDEAKDDDGGDDYADDDCHVDALARIGGGGEIDVF